MDSSNIILADMHNFSPEELAHVVKGTQIEHIQVEPGLMSGKVQRSTHEHTVLDCGKYDRAIMARGDMSHEGVTLAFLMPGRPGGVYRGIPIENPALCIHTEGTELDITLQPDTTWSAFQVPREILSNLGFECPSQMAGMLDIEHESTVDTINKVLGIIRQLRRIAGNGTEDMLALSHDEVLAAYMHAITPGTATRDPATSHMHKRYFERAIDYMHANLSAPLNIAQLCHRLGASYKTLERAFRKQTGLGPHRFFVYLRLSQLRKLLLSKNVDNATVSEVASLCGFTHMGRMSRAYKDMFGEPPSVTLKRTRHRFEM